MLPVASMSGLVANKGFTSSVYNASKAAVCQLARSLAMEWGQVVNGRPVRVNALCPARSSTPSPCSSRLIESCRLTRPASVSLSLPLGNILTPMVKKNFADDPKLRDLWEKENMVRSSSDPLDLISM